MAESPDLPLSEIEAELLRLREEAADLRRERAAIVLERAAIDAERGGWMRRVAEGHKLLEREREEVRRREQDLAAAREAWERERAELARARDALQQRLAQAQRWSVRHRLGVLAHKLPAVRRLRG